MLHALTRILSGCGGETPLMPPTEVYNEGWMLRLVLDWLDRNRTLVHPLSFAPDARWYSEALLASRFLPLARGDTRAEGYTHADGVVGHFTVTPGIRSEAVLLPGARQLMVIEAKMGSPLSEGTKNAAAYDQAARNVACIAHMLGAAGVRPDSFSCLSFCVVAPASQIESGTFGDLVTKASIESKVRQRVASYGGVHDAWFEDIFRPTLDRIDLKLLSWEAILDALPDAADVDDLHRFYAQCRRFNPLRGRQAREGERSSADENGARSLLNQSKIEAAT